MGGYIAECIARELAKKGKGAGARVLVLGLTFKENVPDLRNSHVVDVVKGLKGRGLEIDIHDAFADPEEAKHEYGLALRPTLADAAGYDCVVGAVPHKPYIEFTPETFRGLLAPGGLIADIKGMWRTLPTPDGFRRWQL
jgi:UDP-N-acetyl-D-galactosamine dehydrogenase